MRLDFVFIYENVQIKRYIILTDWSMVICNEGKLEYVH